MPDVCHILSQKEKWLANQALRPKKHLFEVIKLCIDIAQRKETPGAIFCTNTTSPFQYSPRNEPNLCHLSQTSKHCKYICFEHRDKRERERESQTSEFVVFRLHTVCNRILMLRLEYHFRMSLILHPYIHIDMLILPAIALLERVQACHINPIPHLHYPALFND